MAIIPGSAKVLNQYENVNTTYGGSKAMKAQSKWYTMQDVEDTINANLPYTVFTALLTQSGSSGPNQNSEFPLEIGVTYTIIDLGIYILGDFTNVGAPNNEIGTIFIATGTTPNSWGSNISLSWDTGAPVATVLENTIGNIWFTYNDVGYYYLNSDNLFTNSFLLIGSRNVDFGNSSGPNGSFVYDPSLIKLYTLDDTFNPQDGNLYITSIEIRVYN
jgi:hypothetical protein